MKKTQWIEFLYNVKHTIVSFAAIVLFVALSTGLFTGIRWTGHALEASVEAEYTDGHLHHFELSYPYGFDDEFKDALLQKGIVDEIEGYYETYCNLHLDDTRCHARVISLTQRIDRPSCAEGTLPTREGEAAVNAYWAGRNGVHVGDTITLAAGPSSGFLISAVWKEDVDALTSCSDEQNALRQDSFVVTALVEPAAYMGIYADTNGMSPVFPAPVEAVVYVTQGSFDGDAFCGYPKIVVRAESLSGQNTASDEYKEGSDALKAILESEAQAYAGKKYADLQAASGRMRESMKQLEAYAPESEMQRLASAASALDQIRDYDARTETRQMNASFAGLCEVKDTFRRMQYSLVCLFVVIGMLVCYSVVSRLVYDQTVLIGTKKAIGFSANEILRPFLIYSGLAVSIGSVFGVLLGRYLIEPVMVSSVRATYRFGRAVYYFGAGEAVIFALIQAGLLLLTALIASIRVSGQRPLALLTGEAQASASTHRLLEKMPMWKRMPLMKKTIIRNCLNERRRVFATLIGVLGCTALVVSALSMYDNLAGSFDLNMEKISRYDTVALYSGDAEVSENIQALLDENSIRYAGANCLQGVIQAEDGKYMVADLYITDDPDFYELVNLYDISDGKVKQPAQGAWINAAYAKHFGASVGDTVCFIDASKQSHTLSIEGIYDYYLMNYQIILPRSTYEEEFGVSYVPNAVLLRTDDSELAAVRDPLLRLDSGLIIKDFYGGNENLFESILGIARAVSAVYIVLSVVLSVLLLLNLFTMFVSEKKRELITLMINGFPRKTAEQYISTDTRFLAAIGIAAGIVLGIVMGGISLESFNNDATHFLNRPDIKACVIGAVFSSVLTHVMCRIALRKVRRFRLADINAM